MASVRCPQSLDAMIKALAPFPVHVFEDAEAMRASISVMSDASNGSPSVVILCSFRSFNESSRSAASLVDRKVMAFAVVTFGLFLDPFGLRRFLYAGGGSGTNASSGRSVGLFSGSSSGS